MRRTIIPVAVIAMACGDGGPTQPPSYESIAGTYFGSTSGTSQGVSMQADFTVTITQSQGTLGGDYSLMGTLSDGVNVVSLVGGG